MKKILWCVLVLVLTGCAGPRYTGSSIESAEKLEVVIINDVDTKAGFQDAIAAWLDKNLYQYIIVPEGSKYEYEKINLEYSGVWRWDLAIFLSEAKISAYNQGQKIGHVEYNAPNNLNGNKFGNAEERISYMMDILFKKTSVDDANKLLIAEPQ
ncbi:MAG: hypothetical protein IH614_11300 [Desulfuromonadales bacterium]|nr:hypothetical protein [Desulfuromonadales bacterium]